LGSYEVVLIVANECGQDTTRQQFEIGQAPQARYALFPGGGCAPTNIQFANQSTGDYTRFEWRFPGGEPAMSTDPNPEVSYVEPGVYSFSLSVEGPLGNDLVEVTDIIEILAIPEPAFTYELKGDTLYLQNNSEDASSYFWNFGDGETSREENPVHLFGGGGTFNVTLNAGNPYCGKSASQSVSVMVTGTEEALRAAGISLYPNPLTDWLRIDIEKQHLAPLKITLFNGLGQNMEQWRVDSSQSISLSSYPAGLYFIQISSREGDWISRIIKK
jgi:PKD repeat protein